MRTRLRNISEKIILRNLVIALFLAVIGIFITLKLFPTFGESIGSFLALVVIGVVGSFAFLASARQLLEKREPRPAESIPADVSEQPRAPTTGHLAQIGPTPSDFVGRENEIDLFERKVTSEGSRIVGVFGMGGIGKTTLARRWT